MYKLILHGDFKDDIPRSDAAESDQYFIRRTRIALGALVDAGETESGTGKATAIDLV